MKLNEILNLIKEEVKPAMGCTEPVAIALTAAYARSVLAADNIKNIELELSANVYKNACRVGIPGTDCTGVEIAAALGLAADNPVMDLTILSALTAADAEKALRFKDQLPIAVKIAANPPDVVYIAVRLVGGKGFSRAVIMGGHTNLVYLANQDQVYRDQLESGHAAQPVEQRAITGQPLCALIEPLTTAPLVELQFLLDGLTMNMAIAEAGLQMDQGLKLGLSWQGLLDEGLLGDDLFNEVARYTASACDARMSAVRLPVMSSAGSGNHGLVAIIPLAVAARKLKKDDETIARALAISHLVTIYIKQYSGRLSPVCGCSVAAGSGVSAGLVFLLGGGVKSMEGAVTNMVSCFAGMLCDGGKVGCALKLSASASMAWQCALLALKGSIVPAGNGLVGETLRHTLKNLAKISNEGMSAVEESVLTFLRPPA